MASSIECYYRLSSSMVQTHGCSLHPIAQSVGFYDGRDRDIHFLRFYLILISALENIRYLMTYSPDISNISTVISSSGDIAENFCTLSSVTYNVMCARISCVMSTWIHRYRCKRPKQTLSIFLSGHI